MKYHFSGYATKNDLKCSDGRIIRKDAFKHNDGQTVPLVWRHMHDEPDNILGHALLENREDGVYAYCTFNDTVKGQTAKNLVEHGDIKALSIFANGLKEQALNVIHGMIREVSLVLSGANPGARIDNLNFSHGDGSVSVDNEEAIIHTGVDIIVGEVQHQETSDEKTIKDVYDAMTDEQKEVVHAMVAAVVEDADEDEMKQENKGGKEMKHNLFDGSDDKYVKGQALTHEQVQTVIKDAIKMGSMRDSIIQHAGTYGIDNIDVLFPDAKLVGDIEFDKRRTEWVSKVMNAISKSPFSRIKSIYADITEDEARAKGYVTGNEKFEEIFPMFKRTTDPTTVYKKQKLDRDDILDITDLDVVAWLKMEMRMMLEEELAKAYLIGDQRNVTDHDKIDETKIRPIYTDDDIYTHKYQLLSTVSSLGELEAMVIARKFYKGSGSPSLYTTIDKVSEWKLIKDNEGRYYFKTVDEIAAFIGVKEIVEVEVMENVNRDVDATTYDLIGIMVNLRDYTSGADKGGRMGMFDDFDIDFNQYKYLMETRVSGALKKIRSAVVFEKAQAAG